MTESNLVRDMSQSEILKTALDHLSESTAWFYELESNEGKVLAVMADALIICGEALYKNIDPRDHARKDK
jgi:hypothetical protein